jgi:hypothetical protein
MSGRFIFSSDVTRTPYIKGLTGNGQALDNQVKWNY